MKKLTTTGCRWALGGSILIALAVSADAQTLRAPITKKQVKRPAAPPPIYKKAVDGVVPRAFQAGGNPLQMLNPKAPAKYGTTEDHVVLDPETGKWKGIKLFTFNF
jgi:hypothetical protein